MQIINKILAIIILFSTGIANAVPGGSGGKSGLSLGLNLGFINATQKDMNGEIKATSTTTGAGEFGNAWEGNVHFGYRLASAPVVIGLRPSYFFYEEEEGTGAKYALSGYTIFPILKWIMLENANIKFYSQYGVGYGRMNGEIEFDGATVEFAGGDVGYQLGLGAEFCFSGVHCLNLEGNVRFMAVQKFKTESASGTFGGASTVTQAVKGAEFEVNGRDFEASMSGVLAMAGYTLYF